MRRIIQESHLVGALMDTRLVMVVARDRTTMMPLTVIFAVAYFGFVVCSISFRLERCAASPKSPMYALMSLADVEVRRS